MLKSNKSSILYLKSENIEKYYDKYPNLLYSIGKYIDIISYEKLKEYTENPSKIDRDHNKIDKEEEKLEESRDKNATLDKLSYSSLSTTVLNNFCAK